LAKRPILSEAVQLAEGLPVLEVRTLTSGEGRC
jgi:hypothetical protein